MSIGKRRGLTTVEALQAGLWYAKAWRPKESGELGALTRERDIRDIEAAIVSHDDAQRDRRELDAALQAAIDALEAAGAAGEPGEMPAPALERARAILGALEAPEPGS